MKKKLHHLPNGLFKSPFGSWKEPLFSDVLKFIKIRPPKQVKPPRSSLQVSKIHIEKIKNPSVNLQVTWIGHSTMFVQMHGKTFLTDPIFSTGCGPIKYPSRLYNVPEGLEIENLPKIDYVLVSHNHYDHLDYDSIKKLQKVHDPLFIAPLRMEKWFSRSGVTKVVTLDWWEKYEKDDVKIQALPTQHWSNRLMWDKNYYLWCSFAFQAGEKDPKKVYFAGDTGYCDVFKEIGKEEGPFDLALIPIGAYEPRWFMKYQHINPEEAVQIAQDIQAKKSLAMHWGTFVLTHEPILEPPEKLKEDLKLKNLNFEFFETILQGDTLEVKSEEKG